MQETMKGGGMAECESKHEARMMIKNIKICTRETVEVNLIPSLSGSIVLPLLLPIEYECEPALARLDCAMTARRRRRRSGQTCFVLSFLPSSP